MYTIYYIFGDEGNGLLFFSGGASRFIWIKKEELLGIFVGVVVVVGGGGGQKLLVVL